ncbi:MAG: selenium metabolism-associated LysR family transcriptional regulator [Actinomycetota bacterium]|nr:selenium metabolism-associated LysR family transcriptional regulator [Actinomycetota bacterium]
MEIRELKTFCAVIENKSFTKAGSEVHLSQPTVSLQIKSLEREFGVKLLDRMDRGVIATTEGEILYQHAKEILAKVDQIKSDLSESSGNKIAGRLTIGTGVTVGEGLMPLLLGSFKKSYPAVEVVLRILDTAEIIRQMLDYKLDVGIVGADINEKDLVLEKFTEDNLVLIAPPSHPWAKRASVSLDEVVKEPFIIREDGSGTRISIRKKLKVRGIGESDLKVVLELGSTGAIKHAVMGGEGVSIINQKSARYEVKAGLLLEISIDDFEIKKDYYLALHRRRTKSKQLRAFLQFLKQY